MVSALIQEGSSQSIVLSSWLGVGGAGGKRSGYVMQTHLKERKSWRMLLNLLFSLPKAPAGAGLGP